MAYSIGEVSSKTGISVYTLRYYDKEGLMPFVNRNSENGRREFSEKDLDFLSLISCLKRTGMQLSEIREFINWCMEGDSTLNERLQLFYKQKEVVEDKIREQLKNLEKINHKIDYYQRACEAGTESVVEDDCSAFSFTFDELMAQVRDRAQEVG